MFKVGDRVVTPDGDYGEVEYVYPTSADVLVRINPTVSMSYPLDTLTRDPKFAVAMNIIWNDSEPTETKNEEHECRPYVGMSHVEPECTVCGKYIREDKLNEYLRKL